MDIDVRLATTDDAAEIGGLLGELGHPIDATLARTLVNAGERRAIDLNASIIEIGSGRRPERAAAHRFYPALGFEDANDVAARYWKRSA